MSLLKKLMTEESGATAIEYGLIVSLIAIGIITGVTALGSNLSASYNYIASQVKSA